MDKNKVNVQFFRQPKYYDKFSCIGGSCPMSCCLIWNVFWSKEEVEKLKRAECSEHLKNLIDSSFREDKEKYFVIMENGIRCPFLTEDNFCRIQRELGEEYMSRTCMIYPRHSFLSGNIILNCCNLSCYRIMDILCNEKDCMKLENHEYVKNGKITVVNTDKKVDIINHPELKFRQQLFEFFYEILSDDSHSIETSIILGALAAQKLSEYINNGRCDLIPDIIKSIKPQLNNEAQIHNIDEIKPDILRKLAFAVNLDKIIMESDLLSSISENGSVIDTKYYMGVEKFNEAFADRPFALRNIALNLWLEERMPFRDKVLGLFDNYGYFVASFAAVKMVGAAVFASNDDPEEAFKSVSAYVSRSFAHNNVKVRKIAALLKKFQCTSPAYLAAIIK